MKRLVLLTLLMLIVSQPAQASTTLSPIQQAMLRIRNERVEHLLVFNRNGELIGESTGTANRAMPPGNVSLSNTTVLHNHPSPAAPWFSHADYNLADINYVKRMIVITPVTLNGQRMYVVCILERGERWPKLNKDVFISRAKQIGYHAAWTEYAVANGIYYECPVVP